MTDQTTTTPKWWKMTTLGDCPYLIYGDGNYSSKYPKAAEFVDVGIPFISNKDITDGKIISTELRYISEKLHSELTKGHIKYGDVLISTRANIGDIGWVDRNFDGANINAQLVFLRADNENLDPRFLYYLLRSKKYKAIFESYSSGSAQSQLPIHALKEILIIFPSFSEQRAIAAVLSSFDDKIELLREQNKTLEAIARAIFKEWFVRFNFPGATGKMIDSELGKIPEGWRVGKLVEEGVSELVKTNINNFKGTKDYVETANVNLSDFVGNFEKITYEKRPSRANMQPVSNSIWFARMAESRKYLLFQERDLQNIETKILSTGFAGIKCIKDYLYFYWCFILSDIFNDLKNQYAEGAVQVAISNGGIQKIMLVLPPEELAKKFAETVGSCFEKISSNNYQIQTLSKLRDTLLPKLMRGEIRVKGFKD
jgi:type I restriction enzyme S subunit